MSTTKTLKKLLGFTALAGAGLFALAAAAEMDSDLFEGMKARSIGPAGMSGRISIVEAVVSDLNIIFAGSATGGVWRSRDGGMTWQPVFDDMDVASIGALAINGSSRSPPIASTRTSAVPFS